jgi:hypothetical protein
MLFFGIALNCFGQTGGINIDVSVSNSGNETEDYLYRINGISTEEDIGGVEVSRGRYHDNNRYYLSFANYNNFSVSVIYEVETSDIRKLTGTLVLRPYEKKESNDTFFQPESFVLISRKLNN